MSENAPREIDLSAEGRAKGCEHACAAKRLLGWRIMCLAPVREDVDIQLLQDPRPDRKKRSTVDVAYRPANEECIHSDKPDGATCVHALAVKGRPIKARYILEGDPKSLRNDLKDGKLDIDLLWSDGRYVDPSELE